MVVQRTFKFDLKQKKNNPYGYHVNFLQRATFTTNEAFITGHTGSGTSIYNKTYCGPSPKN